MRSLRTILLVPLALALQVVSAHPESVVRTVGGVDFNLAVPDGSCVLGEDNKRDALFINVISTLLRNSGNKLILLMMECGRLKTWRAGVNGNILNYITYYIPTSNETTVLPGDTQGNRKALCAEFRKQGDATLSSVKDSVAKSAEELHADMAVTSTRFIGVLDEDEHGCYVGILTGVKGADQKNIFMSVVMVSTVLHAKPLYSGIYREYLGPETTQGEVQVGKVEAAELDESNP